MRATCVPMLTELWPLAAERGVKFVMNAGGLNPHGARDGGRARVPEKGFKAKIAVVTGDSISERIDELQCRRRSRSRIMDTGADIATRARPDRCSPTPISARRRSPKRWRKAPTSCITGRVADAALSLGPLMHELGWRWDDWDRLAQGLTVGHLLECSGQASGGNFGSAGEWAKVQNFVAPRLSDRRGERGRQRAAHQGARHRRHASRSTRCASNCSTRCTTRTPTTRPTSCSTWARSTSTTSGNDACASPARAARSAPTR